MKTSSIARVLAFAALLGLAPGCKSFLDKDPLGTVTQVNLFNDATNAVHEVAGWDQGPQVRVGRLRDGALRVDVWRHPERRR